MHSSTQYTLKQILKIRWGGRVDREKPKCEIMKNATKQRVKKIKAPFFLLFFRVGGRQTETDTQRETDRDRETERGTETDTEREKRERAI